MSLADEARLLETIAIKLAEVGEDETSDVLFYAEAGAAWAGGSIFVSDGERIHWVDAGEENPLDLVMQLWTNAPQDKKWRGMTMIVSGDKFRVEFDYGENWSPDEDESDRREPIILRFFGNKPICYPLLDWVGRTTGL